MKGFSVIEEDALAAYIYGYPIVLMEATKKNMLSGGLHNNQFLNERYFPGPKTNIVVRPNVDTLYTTAWLDLSKEPVVLHVPNTNGRYYVMEMLDAWTNVFASVGSRTTGTAECDFVITGPGSNAILPQNLSRITSPTNTAWILARIQTNGTKDYSVVNSLQENFKLAPLGYFEKYGTLGINDKFTKKIIIKRPATKNQVEAMDAATFFTIMVNSINANPPSIQDMAMNNKLAALGLTGGETFDFANLTPSASHALDIAARNGPKIIRNEWEAAYKKNQKYGWMVPLQYMGIYGTNYVQRAAVAMFLLGANIPEDAVYGFSYLDENEKSLKGACHYHLHFNKDQFPPVNAFWSITLYNQEGFLTENMIKRYAVSPHLENLQYNTDGSLDIYIQNTQPGSSKTSNWLPSPKGNFNLTYRMYWPSQELLNAVWQYTPTVKKVCN